MPKPEVHLLKSISPRNIWEHEAHDFTPWLAKHIDRLGDAIGLKLENVRREVFLRGAGKADLLAREVGTDSRVVIENQLNNSDSDHFLRLLGYAAKAEADILIWVAQEFTSYHESILEWLNAADNIDIYAVTLQAYRLNGVDGMRFRAVIEPPRPQQGGSPPGRKTLATLAGEHYKPIIKRLEQEDIPVISPGKHRGFVGRFRSFRTTYPNIIYSTAFDIPNGELRVNLGFRGLDRRPVYDALFQRREELEKDLGGLTWDGEGKDGWITLRRNGAPHPSAPQEEIDSARKWLVDSILELRKFILPLIDKILQDPSESVKSEETWHARMAL